MSRTAHVWSVVGIVVLALVIMSFLPAVSPFGANLIGVGMIVLVAAFWAAVIGGGIWLALHISGVAPLRTGKDDAMSMLRQRYARGEISRAEFFQMKQDLEADC